MDELTELGVAENTVLVAHADNGPMVHDPPPGLGMAETVFRGGKSDYWEGGIRVAAFAWWPGMIEPGSLVGDMLHEVDLYATFARLAGATGNIPTDRIVDGIDQTALLLKGDTHGRRDYNFVYTGNILAASTKGRYKRVWVGDHPGLPGAAFYDLYNDPREKFPALVPYLATSSSFTQMRARHELWKQKYPVARPSAACPSRASTMLAKRQSSSPTRRSTLIRCRSTLWSTSNSTCLGTGSTPTDRTSFNARP
jgi:arylsulfatase A-like enzyme